MRKKGFLVVAVLGLAAAAFGQSLRKPVWAGTFYDADKARLAARLERDLADAAPAPVPGEIRALIVPHAGYAYSGRIAAFGYKLVQGGDYETVVILGPSHRVGFEGASVWPEGGFETPLGLAAVDADAARRLNQAAGFRFRTEAHAEEHSVEVQVPWIQTVLPRAKIVPVVMGLPSEKTMRALASALAELGKVRKILVVASTDMSHYLKKSEANALDLDTAELVRTLKTGPLLRRIERNENRMCGGAAVLAALFYAQKTGAVRVDILKYADSSEAGASADGVVGYMAAAVSTTAEFTLSDGQKKELLALARRTLESFVKDGAVPPFETTDVRLSDPRGAFVTLTKKGELRGCIGFMEPLAPLFKAVQQCAVYASSEDPRFPPVTAPELKDIAIEISVLTPPRKIDDPNLVQVGRHGLVMSRGGRRGVLLPQVATENGWNREEFLSQCCLKAGLPPDAWKKGATIEVFEAIVFR
jgi:AmmeMemoRadiSam system protein B/AmmeMemoRadiSam system protein A